MCCRVRARYAIWLCEVMESKRQLDDAEEYLKTGLEEWKKEKSTDVKTEDV